MPRTRGSRRRGRRPGGARQLSASESCYFRPCFSSACLTYLPKPSAAKKYKLEPHLASGRFCHTMAGREMRCGIYFLFFYLHWLATGRGGGGVVGTRGDKRALHSAEPEAGAA
jgi:hypothetical protein